MTDVAVKAAADMLAKVRSDPRVPKPPEARIMDRKDRIEATNAADAVKARAVVRELATGSLPLIVQAIIRHTSDLGVKHAMQAAFERFAVANEAYAREELKPANWLLEWAGGVGHGVMPALPPGTPEHKVEFAAAWNAMLAKVNEATKVGIYKPRREWPIMLMADIETPTNQEWN